MIDSPAIFAFLAMLLSVGAIAIAARAVAGAAEQYETFVKNHIASLRIDLTTKSNELTKSILDVSKRTEGNTRTEMATKELIAEVRRELTEVKERLAMIEAMDKVSKKVARRNDRTTMNPNTGLREKVG